MVIGVVNNLFPPYGRGSGAEVVAANMVNELRIAGHEVFIITTKPHRVQRSDLVDLYYLPSRYEALKKLTNLHKIIWYLGQLSLPLHRRRLQQILQDRQPDLVITHNLIGLGFFLPRLLHQLHIKHEHVLHDIQLLHPSGLMYWQHENLITSLPARCYQLATRRSLRWAQKIISPSEWLLKLHQAHGFFTSQTSVVQTNFQLQKLTPKPLVKPAHFVFTGQLEEHKGLKVLLAAWQQAGLPATRAHLSIAGGGSLSDWIKDQCTPTNNSRYLGYLERDGIEKLLATAQVVITPSLVYENSPTSIWEAASHGLNAIASDIGGIPELKNYLNLHLIPPGDIEALAQKIVQLSA